MLRYGYHSMQGAHHDNEDTYVIKQNVLKGEGVPIVAFAAVYDGHGGGLCSKFTKKRLHRYFAENLTPSILKKKSSYMTISGNDQAFDRVFGNQEANATIFGLTAEVEDHIKEALLKAFARVEDEFILYSIEKQDFSGCCANVVVLHADKVYSANLGDSRAIMIRAADGKPSSAKPVVLSRDHKAALEKERVEKAGGFIHAGRVNGVLAISRTLGDREFKDPRILALMEGKAKAKRENRNSLQEPIQPINSPVEESPPPSPVLSAKKDRVSALKQESDTISRKTRVNSSKLLRKSEAAADSGSEPASAAEDSSASNSGDLGKAEAAGSELDGIPDEDVLKAKLAISSPAVSKRRKNSSDRNTSLTAPEPEATPEQPQRAETSHEDELHSEAVSTYNTISSPSLRTPSRILTPQVEGRKSSFLKFWKAEKKSDSFQDQDPAALDVCNTHSVVSAEPEIRIYQRTTEDNIILLASDGLWDTLSNKTVATTATKLLYRAGADSSSDICSQIADDAAARGSQDDITVVLMVLKRLRPQDIS